MDKPRSKLYIIKTEKGYFKAQRLGDKHKLHGTSHILVPEKERATRFFSTCSLNRILNYYFPDNDELKDLKYEIEEEF